MSWCGAALRAILGKPHRFGLVPAAANVLDFDMTSDHPDSKMLCYCRNVKYGEVRASIEKVNATKVEQVMADCTAGTGCRTCHNEIEELIEAHRSIQVGWLTRLWRKMRARG